MRVSGLDAVMFLRVVKFGAEVFLWITIWSMLVILPINLSGTSVQQQLEEQAQAQANSTTIKVQPPLRVILADLNQSTESPPTSFSNLFTTKGQSIMKCHEEPVSPWLTQFNGFCFRKKIDPV